MRGLSPPRSDAIMVLTLAAVFFAGTTIGGLFAHENESMRFAWNNAKVATYLPDGPAAITSR